MTEPETFAELARTPAERAASAVPWAGIAVWTAAEVMHWAAWPGMAAETAMAAVAAFGLSFGISAHKGWGWKAPLLIGAFAVWLALASARGPLDGFPVPPLTIVLAVLTGIAWRLASRHPSILEAVKWRAARAEWLAVRHAWHLPGSHLLARQETRLGEQFLVDVTATRKLASAIARDAALPEWIAMDRGIPRTRVTIKEAAPAGRVLVDIRDRDPWEHPILHPLLDPEPQRGLAEADAAVIGAIRGGGSFSITAPVPVGQDPATGAVLAVALWDEVGGKNVNIVGIKGAGKGVLLNCLSEGITRAQDAVQVRVNLSFKGHAEAERWGPSCLLTAFGPQQQARAVRVLRAVLRILEWRALTYTATQYAPSAADPHITVIFDESDSAMSVPMVRKLADDIATKGREYGASLAKAGQRGTVDYSSAKQRSQDDVFCLGMVNRSTEAMHAAGELGLRLPDMATYGEGRSGVWVIARLGSPAWKAGRTWNLSEPTDIAGIAAERAPYQPDLPAECKAFLGDEWGALAGSDVYARWARGRGHAPSPAAHSAPGAGGTGPLLEGPAAPVAVAEPRADLDRLSDYEGEVDEILDYGDDGLRAQFNALGEKIGQAREVLRETEALPPHPEVPEEKLKASSEERWRQAGDQAVIPDDAMEPLISLLREGTTTSAVARAFGISSWTARTWLQKLRNAGVAHVEGVKRGARWKLTQDGDGT